MSKKTGNYKIPFNDGNQCDYEPTYHPERIQWLDNFEFEDELKFVTYTKGRSSIGFAFNRKSSGKQVSFFVSDFSDVIPKLIDGKLIGRFTFVKKGANYGCRMIFE